MVKLVKMSKQDFDSYILNAVIDYAKEKVKAGTWCEEEARDLSEKTFSQLLPQGVDTENQYLFSIMETDKQVKIGYLWFQYSQTLVRKDAFIFDFVIFEEFRGKGYGYESLKAFEEEAKKLDIEKVTLHVFSHNKRAIALYQKFGFEDTDIIMSKYI